MSLFADIGGAIINSAAKEITSHIPAQTMSSINLGLDAVGMAANGNFDGLASLALSELSGHVGGFAGDVLGQLNHGGSMIHGGISPDDAVQLYREAMAATHARKNLFFISIESNYFNDLSGLFNLYAVDVERGPSEVSGSKVRAGSAQIDLLTQSEPVVLRITTMDDAKGTLKKWFEIQTAAVARADGSFGVPGGPNGYALTITIQHAFAAGTGGFTGTVLCRPQSYEVGLSRREDTVEELQMTFMQLDTFL